MLHRGLVRAELRTNPLLPEALALPLSAGNTCCPAAGKEQHSPCELLGIQGKEEQAGLN